MRPLNNVVLQRSQSFLLMDTILVSAFPVAHVLQTGVFLCPFAIQSKKFNMFWRILSDSVFLIWFSIFTFQIHLIVLEESLHSAIFPIRKAFSFIARRRSKISVAACSGTTAMRPIPLLNVRIISASETLPAS